MRTVIFFGLMTIAESIGYLSGWKLAEIEVNFAAGIFIFAVVLDFVGLLKKI